MAAKGTGAAPRDLIERHLARFAAGEFHDMSLDFDESCRPMMLVGDQVLAIPIEEFLKDLEGVHGAVNLGKAEIVRLDETYVDENSALVIADILDPGGAFVRIRFVLAQLRDHWAIVHCLSSTTR